MLFIGKKNEYLWEVDDAKEWNYNSLHVDLDCTCSELYFIRNESSFGWIRYRILHSLAGTRSHFPLFCGCCRFGVWSKLPGALRKCFIGMVSVGGVCFLIIEGCVISGFSRHGEPKLDYIIVLGAQVYEHGPSRVLKYRLDEAIEYLNDNPDTMCIVSGGKGHNEPFAEAIGMADYFKKNGISEERIVLETKSLTTEQNISNSMELMEKDSSVGIVTNNFHMFRAIQIAKKQGLKNVCGIAAESTQLYLHNNMLREFFAMVKFLIM